MIAIIKQGMLPEVKFKGICINCKCEIVATSDEHNNKFPISSKCRVILVNCPTAGCGYHIKCGKMTKERQTTFATDEN